MDIDLKFHAEKHKSKVIKELDKMITASQQIEAFQKIDFDFLNYEAINLKRLDLKNVIYIFKVTDFGEKLNSSSFCNRIQITSPGAAMHLMVQFDQQWSQAEIAHAAESAGLPLVSSASYYSGAARANEFLAPLPKYCHLV